MNYKSIDISSWIQEGEGGVGKTYSHPDNPGVMLKVNKASNHSDEAAMKREVEMAQHVLALGLTTPKMYDIVRVGDCFGMTFERIQGKKSLARICADEPSRIVEIASLLATEGKLLHTTPCDTAFFPSRKEQSLTAIDAAPFVRLGRGEALLDRPGMVQLRHTTVRPWPPVSALQRLFPVSGPARHYPHDAGAVAGFLGCFCHSLFRQCRTCRLRCSRSQVCSTRRVLPLP